MTAEECGRLLALERKARAKAESTNRLMDDVIAMVSHEMRAPLQSILGWAALMKVNPHDGQLVAEGIDDVARNTRIQEHLVSDLLEMVELTSGEFRLDLQRIQLPAVVESAVAMVRPAATAKRIAIAEDLDDSIDPIDADPTRLQQAFGNVLSNAVKFTPHYGHIRVALQRRESQADVVIEDDGPGIQSDFLPHVFDRFRQGHGTRRSRHGDGLGLGLWIVRSLVQLHGGTVRAESAGEGLGSKFTVALPLKTSHLREHA